MEENAKKFIDFIRGLIYASVIVEFVAYVMTEQHAGDMAGAFSSLHGMLTKLYPYQEGHLHYSKIVTFILICLTSLGTRARKEVKFDSQRMVIIPLIVGILFTISSILVYNSEHDFGLNFLHIPLNIWVYMTLTILGTALMHKALDAISKFIKGGFGEDRFNMENESFAQCTELVTNDYSVNIPMRFYYDGKFRNGWINITNPFRGTWVLGTPGSGKTFSVIEPVMRQHSEKGFCIVLYDFKFPTLTNKLYYHYRDNKWKGKLPSGCKFNIINFDDVECSQRVNPIQCKYIDSLAQAQETAKTLVDSLSKGKGGEGGGSDQFFQDSAVAFLSACIYYFLNYKKLPYDADGNVLFPEYVIDEDTKHKKLTGRVFSSEEHRKAAFLFAKKNKGKTDEMGKQLTYTNGLVTPAYWLGKYSDMPHILAFINRPYDEIFDVLKTNKEVFSLLAPFMSAKEGGAMEQLEGMIGTLRVKVAKLDTVEARWIFHRDGDDFDLKVSDKNHPSYLVIANNPDKQEIIGALNALVLNRLVTKVNTKGNLPVSIIIDELPTLFFYKIATLIATARSNKVAVCLGFQEMPQLEGDYGKTGSQEVVTTVGNIITGSARSKETLEWLSNDIFGKVTQVKKGLTIDREKVSVNLNENTDNLIPASKIASMPQGWLAGIVTREFIPTKKGKGDLKMDILKSEELKPSTFFCKTNFDMKEINANEAEYKKIKLPRPYKFGTPDEKARILDANFSRVNQDIEEMIMEIQMENVR